ncbi:MAG: DUF4276 family protein [bacterium]|nr:DUF4276 family protein [bacterium]
MRVTLRIVVEGQTEETFVNEILKPYLSGFSVDVSAHVLNPIERSDKGQPGGLNSYGQVKKEINLWLKTDQDENARVTTMLDLYELTDDFPGYRDAALHSDPCRRVQALEDALAEEMGDNRFIPYIQLHEFEALLLSDPRKFESWFYNCMDGIANLVEMVAGFPSPEHVNDDDPPSKRINRELLNYKYYKRIAGLSAAKQIGLPTLRAKCAHFAKWLAELENLGQ